MPPLPLDPPKVLALEIGAVDLMDIPTSHARTCKGCGGDVAFVKVPGKKKGETIWTPVDFKPSAEAGTYLVEVEPAAQRPALRPALRGGRIDKRGVREGMKAAGVTLHTNHYKTCPKAELFKRLRKPLF